MELNKGHLLEQHEIGMEVMFLILIVAATKAKLLEKKKLKESGACFVFLLMIQNISDQNGSQCINLKSQ